MANGNFGGGNGTELDPYLVEDRFDLLATEPWGPEGNMADKHYKQVADIDLSNVIWRSFGNIVGPYFSGVYDGNGYGIYNMTINDIIDNVGLWGQINVDGVIKNLTITGFVTGQGQVGIITGINNGTVENCSVYGYVNASAYGGGICGILSSGTISECSSYVNVNVTNLHAGGITGHILSPGDSISTVSNCYSKGDISLSVESTNAIGGLIGRIATDDAVIENCYSTGLVSRPGTSTVDIGGLIGSLSGASPTINNSYYNSETSGQSDTGKGEPKTTVELQLQSTFNGWDFSSIWDITDSYPFLINNNDESILLDDIIESGTENNPYGVSDVDDLLSIADDMAAHYIQTDDIDLLSHGDWSPLQGQPRGMLEGSYDGDGYKITNLTGSGLFHGVDYGGIIENLYIENCDIDDSSIIYSYFGVGAVKNCYVSGIVNITRHSSGGLVPGINDGSILENCNFEGDVSTSDPDQTYGGICDYIYDGGIVNGCVFEGSITGGSIGGIAFGSTDNALIKNCKFSGTINTTKGIGGIINYSQGKILNCTVDGLLTTTSNDEPAIHIGGIVGTSWKYTEYAKIHGCQVEADLTGGYMVGGILGTGDTPITQSYFKGNINGEKKIGGIVGEYHDPGTITNCYCIGDLSGSVADDEQPTSTSSGGSIGVSFGAVSVNNFYCIGELLGERIVGGIIGSNFGDVIIQNCYWNDDISVIGFNAPSHTPNIVDSNQKTKNELKKKNTFINWDFKNIWYIKNSLNNGYPVLRILTDILEVRHIIPELIDKKIPNMIPKTN